MKWVGIFWPGDYRARPIPGDLGCWMETIIALEHYLSSHIAAPDGDVIGEMVAASQSLGFRVRVMQKS